MEKPELLEKIEPNLELVKTLLTHRDLLNPKTRILARKIIDKVVEELKRKMQVQVEQAITGAIRKDRHSPRKVFRNLDLKTTLRRNLTRTSTRSRASCSSIGSSSTPPSGRRNRGTSSSSSINPVRCSKVRSSRR